jgi:hypothetical protein
LQFLGKYVLIAGLVLVALGLVLTFVHHVPFLGRLPGDIHIERKGFTFYFPVVTCLLLSLLLTVLLNIFRR